METYNANNNRYEMGEQTKSSALSLVKVFLYLTLGLIVTFGVSYGWPFLVLGMTGNNADVAQTVNIVAIIISVIYMFVGTFMIGRKAFGKKTVSMAIMYYLYTVAMGILCSSIFYVATGITFGNTGIPIIALAFGISAGCMLLCALSAFIFRKQMNIIISILPALLIGAIILSIVNIFLWPLTGGGNWLYWIIDYFIFGVILIMTMVDLFRIKKMADAGWLEDETNLAYYAAFSIYVDFIAILVRVIYYLILANRSN